MDNKYELKVLTSVYCFCIRVMWWILQQIFFFLRFSFLGTKKSPSLFLSIQAFLLFVLPSEHTKNFPFQLKLNWPVAMRTIVALVFKRIIVKQKTYLKSVQFNRSLQKQNLLVIYFEIQQYILDTLTNFTLIQKCKYDSERQFLNE